MTTLGWRLFVAAQVLAVVCALVTPLTILITGSVAWFQVLFLGLNVLTVVLVRYNHRKMKALHGDWLLRRDNFYRKLRHARERGDPWEEAMTLDLMAIWKIKPPADHPSSR